MNTNRKFDWEVIVPGLLVLVAALIYRHSFALANRTIGLDALSAMVFLFLGLAALSLALVGHRKPVDVVVKMAWILVIWLFLYGNAWGFAKYLMGSFVCFGFAEWLLEGRDVQNRDPYYRDWAVAFFLALAWGFRSLILTFDFGDNTKMFANVIAIILIAFAGLFLSIGDEKLNPRVQWSFMAICIFMLQSEHANFILGYWTLTNIALKANEWLSTTRESLWK